MWTVPALIDDRRLHPGPGNGQLRVGQWFLLEPGDGAPDLVMMVMVVVMVQPGQAAGRPVVLLMVVVQPEHEAGRGGVPVMVAGRRVQLAAPRGHGVQFATAAATDDVTSDVTAAAAVTDIANVAERAQRGLPRCRDRDVRVAAGRAARPVAGAGHRPSVFFRRHHRDAFRAHRRPIRVRQRAFALYNGRVYRR